MSVKYLLRFLSYFIIISLFSIFRYYVFSVLHVSYLHVCFVNISIYILSEIQSDRQIFFVLIVLCLLMVNAVHSDLVTCNNFINCKRSPVFDFLFIDLESSRLLQTEITPERKCISDYCFSLALFIFAIICHHFDLCVS